MALANLSHVEARRNSEINAATAAGSQHHQVVDSSPREAVILRNVLKHMQTEAMKDILNILELISHSDSATASSRKQVMDVFGSLSRSTVEAVNTVITLGE